MEAQPAACPRCSDRALYAGQAGALTLHACGRCGGVFVPPAIADAILGGVQTSAPPRPAELRCPTCSTGMSPLDIHDARTTVDRCPAGDGVWFDYRELEAVCTVFAAARRRPMPKLPEPPTAGGSEDAIAGAIAGSAFAAVAVLERNPSPQTGRDPVSSNDSIDLVDGLLLGEVVMASGEVSSSLASAAPEVVSSAAEVGSELAVGGVEAAAEVGSWFAGAIGGVLGALID